MSKAQILDHVWQYDFGGDGGVVETYIGYLRRKIDNVEPALIHTIRGVGYTLRENGRCRCAAACSQAWRSSPFVLVGAGGDHHPHDARRTSSTASTTQLCVGRQPLTPGWSAPARVRGSDANVLRRRASRTA